MKYNHQFLFFILSIGLVSCAVGPDYRRPPVIVPIQFKEAKGRHIIGAKKNWKMAEPSDHRKRGAWWKIFNDKKLNQLEAQLNSCNQSLLTAFENYKNASALIDEARANYFPTLSANYSANRQKQGGGATSFVSTSSTGVSTGTAVNTNKNTSGGGTITGSQSLSFSASWEPDIWGLTRRTVEANIANAQASYALFSATLLSLQASLAVYYFELRGLDMDQKILDETVANYRQSLKLTKNQYASGVAARVDIVQAQSQLETAKAQAINNHILRAQYEHAIAILIGIPPALFAIKSNPIKITPPFVPLEVPSTLLERRPDIAQAERLMAQANAQIGIAVAAYYPQLTLTGTAGVVAQGFSHLFSLPNWGWSYGANISELIFDGGLRKATIHAAEANYLATVASYRQVVLAAFQDVEDNLVSLRILNQEAIIQNAAAADARLALKLVINQYRSGIVPYSSVITAQTTAFTAEKIAADITYLRMVSAVNLVRAMGGSWNCA